MRWGQGWRILILWDSTEKSDFRGEGGGHEKSIYRGKLPKKGGLDKSLQI